MDGNRFDELTRSFAGNASRRSVLKMLGSGIAAGIAGVVSAAGVLGASCRNTGEICRKHGECCTNKCSVPDATGRSRCFCSTTPDCPAPANKCLKVTCAAGKCVTSNACTSGQVCFQQACCTPNTDEATCEGICDQTVTNNCGIPVVCPPCCTPVEGDCGSNADCCSGVCISGSCAAQVSGPGGSCDEVADCQNGLLCCSGTCRQCCQTSDCASLNTDCSTFACVTGICSPTHAAINTSCNDNGGSFCDGNGACVQCNTPSQCPGQDTECQTRTCESNECGFSFQPNGTPLSSQTAGDCKRAICDGAGGVTTETDNSDTPVDGNQCTQDICTAGVPSNPAEPMDTVCTQNGGSFCNATGACVECNTTSQCLAPGAELCCGEQCVPDDVNNCGSCGNVCTGSGLESCGFVCDITNECTPTKICCAGQNQSCALGPCCSGFLPGVAPIGEAGCICALAGDEGDTL